MQLLTLVLLLGSVSANPLALFKRQAPASCTATYLASCTGAASTSARAWCTSQGFGRATVTATLTNTNRRTVQSTVTTFTATSTITLPTSTRTVSSVRTVITTSTITGVTTVDHTSTLPVTGSFSACPVYVPAQAPPPEIDPPTESSSPTVTAPREQPTDTWQPGAKLTACVEDSRHIHADSDGQVYEYIRCPGHGDSTIGVNRYANISVSSFDECAKFCRYNDKCQGFNWATNNPGTCDADGMQNGSPENGIYIVATQDGGGNDPVQCKIEPTEDDQCALFCTSGSYSVNSRNGNGVWGLLDEGAPHEFTNYVFSANVALEERSLFRKREAEMRRAVVKAKKH